MADILPKTSNIDLAAAHSRYFSPGAPFIDAKEYPKFHETKFRDIITKVGSFKIKKKESPLLMYYFIIKLSCKTDRFEYETIVFGDQYDREDDARENAFAKATAIVLSKYGSQFVKGQQQKGTLQTAPTMMC